MGKLVWSEWGRLCAISSAIYMFWASLWALFYRKFFWDFVGGKLGPAGIIPGANTIPLVAIVVEAPLLQIFTILISLWTLMLELPVPFVAGTALHRSLALRVGLYFLAAFVGIMVYQTVDCSVYYLITSMVYAKAMLGGEVTEKSKEDTSNV